MTVRRSHPPARAMRESPDIDQLKRQARELLEAYRAQSPDTIIEVAAHHRTATPETFALHDAQFVLARGVEMTRLLLEAGADTRDGIWPNRDATSPRTIAEERGYDEIVALMTAQEEKRGARSVNAHGDGVRRLRDAMMTGGEEAVIAVFESEPGLAGMCPPDGVTMLHRAAQYGLLRAATWLLDHGADMNKSSQPDF